MASSWSITPRIAFGEVVDSAVDLVAAGQGRTLVGEAGSFRLQLAVTGGDVSGPPLQVSHFDQAGLVEVDQPALLRVGGVDLAVQAAQFGGEQLVVGDRGGEGEVCAPVSSRFWLSSARLIWSNTNSSSASARMLRSGQRRSCPPARRVVVTAVVIAVPAAVTATHLVAVGADAAGTAFDQAPQQPLLGIGPARAPLAVVDCDPPAASNTSSVTMRTVDPDPVGAVTRHLTAAAGGPPIRHRFGAVEVDPSHIGFVAQQPGQRGVRPRRLPRRRRHLIGVEATQISRTVVPAARSAKMRRTTAASGS